MKKFFSLVLALVMALSLTTVAWGATEKPCASNPCAHGAAIGTAHYDTLADAVADVATGGTATITLLKSHSGAGILLDDADNKTITIDFATYTYTCTGPAVGSAGTATQAFHLEENNTVKMMNGTVTSNCADVKMLVQNYCDLTLENMVLDGTQLPGSGRYTLSNNQGNVVIDDTTITAAADGIAFDTCQFAAYTPPTVTVKGTSVINGDVEASGGKLEVQSGTVNGDIKVGTGGHTSDVVVKGGTFTDNVSDYVPAGYAQFNANTGFTVNPVAPGTSSTGDYDLHAATALGTVVKEDCSYKKVAATYNEATGTGDLEYYVINGTDAYVVISVADATTSDFYLTEANKTAPLFYLRKIDSVADVHYDFIAKEFTDFGVKCGQMNAAYADYYTNEVSFYVWTDPVTGGKVYFADDAVTAGAPFYNGAVLRSGASNLLVGKEIVKAYGFVVSGTDAPADPLNQHVWSPVAYDKAVPTQALCGICGAKANLYKDGKVPAMSVVDARFDINGTFYNAVVTSTGYTGTYVPSTPSTDKVQSAETFDAGIAMYVGMSVMAAAGSAVVLKKKD